MPTRIGAGDGDNQHIIPGERATGAQTTELRRCRAADECPPSMGDRRLAPAPLVAARSHFRANRPLPPLTPAASSPPRHAGLCLVGTSTHPLFEYKSRQDYRNAAVPPGIWEQLSEQPAAGTACPWRADPPSLTHLPIAKHRPAIGAKGRSPDRLPGCRGGVEPREPGRGTWLAIVRRVSR